MTDDATITAVVADQWTAADGVKAVELAAADGAPLPPANAGAHVDVHLPDGLIRQYSLMTPGEPRYRLGVLRDESSRGGSAYIVERLRLGDRLAISAPRNHFALDESGEDYVLIAGGIGITPLFAMAMRLTSLGRRFQLHYLVRSRTRAAFARTLAERLPASALTLHAEDECGRPDLTTLVGAPAPGRQLYVCGPGGLLDAVADTTRDWPTGSVRSERFRNDAAPADTAAEQPCRIELHRSGRELTLEPGESVLECLNRAGVTVETVCQDGICGTCAVPVIEGEVDHRDAIQTDDEKAAGDLMFVCVSRPRSERLVLDL